MAGLPESVLIFAALAITIGIVLFAAAGLLPRVTRTAVRAFWCPFRRTEVTVEFEEDSVGHGRYLGVKSCTAFEPVSAISCGKPCLYLRDFPPAPGIHKAAA